MEPIHRAVQPDPPPGSTLARRNRIVEDNLPLAYYLARQLKGRYPRVELEELQSLARLALLLAAERWQPERGSLAGLTAYTLRGMLNHQWVRKPQPVGVVSLDAPDEEGRAMDLPDPSPGVAERVERRLLLQQALRALPPEERALVWARYAQGEPLPRLAQRCGLAPRALQTRLDRALFQMRRLLEDGGEE
ncbi:MAG: sigma-70 family RNA polymerase sigma factor [Christensenellales bacterium]|jgi:RNA polymerase sigma factor (sigma-70 family)